MDEHARRMMQHFLDDVEAFRRGDITLLDLSRRAGQTAATIDNASAPLPELLEKAEGDLEYSYFAVEVGEHSEEAARIVAPIIAAFYDGRSDPSE